MRMRLLGPLEVTVDDAQVDLGGLRQQQLLALLIVFAGESVSVDRLADEMWGEQPPPTARKTIQGYVSGLRRLLGRDLIETTAAGYRFSTDVATLDTVEISHAAQRAAALVYDDPEGALQVADSGLSLWVGEPFAGLPDAPAFAPERTRAHDARSSLLESRVTALVLAGHQTTALTELSSLLTDNPLNERLWALRMVALYRNGQQTAALRCYDEARRTLAEEVGLEPGHELKLVEQRVLDQDPLLDGPRALAEQPPEDGPVQNPYKGLRPFESDDAHHFHGRAGVVRRIVEMVTDRDARIVVLAGPSGSGKSSVVRAGLVPTIKELGWTTHTRFAGEDMPEGPLPSNTVLIVDQLEELVALGGEALNSNLDKLVALSNASSGAVIVATLRSDALDPFLRHPGMARHLESTLVLLPPLEDHEVREIIQKPASGVGVAVEADLIGSIVSEARGRPTILPLIQFALTDLFDRRAGGPMTLTGLEAAGGIGGAMSRRAEETYQSLDTESQRATRQVILSLIAIGEDGQTYRRRAPLNDVEAIPNAEKVIDAYTHIRLLTTDRNRDGVRTIEVAHESLLEEWKRIGDWVDDARDAVIRHRRLAEATSEWEASDRDPSHLVSGTRLARLSDDSGGLNRTPTESAFLDASHERERAAQSMARRRRTALTASFGLIAVVALVLAVIAYIGQDRARLAEESARAAEAAALANEQEALAETARAEASADEAHRNALAQAAQVVISEDPELAVLLALESVAGASNPSVASRLTLRRAMSEDRLLHTLNITDGRPMTGADLSPDGSRMVALEPGTLRMIDTETWEDIWTYADTGFEFQGLGQPAFSHDGSKIAVGTGSLDTSGPRTIVVLDSETGDLLTQVALEGSACVATPGPEPWAADDGLLGIWVVGDCGDPATIEARILDTDSWEAVFTLPGDYVTSFAAKAPRVAFIERADGVNLKRVRVYETDSWTELLDVDGDTGDISDDGTLLAADVSASPTIWDVDTGGKVDQLVGLDYSPTLGATAFITFDPPGELTPPVQLLVVGTSGQTTAVWNVESGGLVFSLPTGTVVYLGYDQEAAELYTFGAQGEVQIWDFGAPGSDDPIGQVLPLWFDANSFRTNPASKLGSVQHNDQITSVVYFGTFDTSTGALNPSVSPIFPFSFVIPALPNERFAFITGDPGPPPLVGPLVTADADGNVATLAGCALTFESWEAFEVLPPECVGGGDPIRVIESPELSADGSELLVTSADGTLRAWDSTSLELNTETDMRPSLTVEALAGLLGWDLENLTGRQETTLVPLMGHTAVVRAAAADWILLEQLPEGVMSVHSRPDLDPIAAFELKTTAWGQETSHDASFVLLGGDTQGIYRLDVGEWTPRLLIETVGRVRGISISPDNTKVMLGGTDGLVHIHDTSTGVLLDQIPLQHVSDGYWLDDTRIVVGTGQTGEWRIIDTDLDRLIARAHAQLSRGFTDAECVLYDIEPCPTLDELIAP